MNCVFRKFVLFIMICFMITACSQRESIKQEMLLISVSADVIKNVEIISADGQNVSRVVSVPSYALLKLSPDGQRLAVLADRTLTIINVTSGKQIVELSNVGQTKSEHFGNGHIAWSPDNNKIVYVRNSTKGVDLWLYDFLRKQEIQITHNNAVNLYPAWANGGMQIAYVTNEQCKNGVNKCQDVFWWDIATYSLENDKQAIITSFAQSELSSTDSLFVPLLCGLKWKGDDQFIAFENECGNLSGLNWYKNIYLTSVNDLNLWQVTSFNQYSGTSNEFPANLYTYSYDWLNGKDKLWIGYSQYELKEGGKMLQGSLIAALSSSGVELEYPQDSSAPVGAGINWSPHKQYVLWNATNPLGYPVDNPSLGKYDGGIFYEFDFTPSLPFGTCYDESVYWSLTEQYVGYISNTQSGSCEPGVEEISLVIVDVDKRTYFTIFINGDIDLLGWTTFISR